MTKTLLAAPIIAAVLLSGSAFAALPPASAPKPAVAAKTQKTDKAKPAHAHHHKKTDEVKKPA